MPSLVNVVARNADGSRTAVASSDVDGAKALRQAEAALGASVTAWKAGDLAAATTDAARARTSFETVESALADKKAVPEVEDAIDTYSAEAGKAGDAAEVPADATEAIEAAQVAEQALVGQFWTDAAVRQQVAVG